MFAGEGPPEKTNQRFHYLCEGEDVHRLSTAFDSVTLYGEDPDLRPDIYGKVGESGVSICNLEDMKKLYAGFDLCAASTSVSMTINGPAPMILAMFFNAAFDQQVELHRQKTASDPSPAQLEEIRSHVLRSVRGTVQADILKEDQAQNTCIFSTDFALRMMGDIQQFFIDEQVRNYYSVSISGYHIAEAGANPITQLAFTLANGFTYVENYLSRGMSVPPVRCGGDRGVAIHPVRRVRTGRCALLDHGSTVQDRSSVPPSSAIVQAIGSIGKGSGTLPRISLLGYPDLRSEGAAWRVTGTDGTDSLPPPQYRTQLAWR
jgi:hypothetical protein